MVTISQEEVADFRAVNDDGSYKDKSLAHHIGKFKGFLLSYNCQWYEVSTSLDEEDVLEITKAKINDYLGSPKYHADLEAGFAPSAQVVIDGITPQEIS
jgi:hypothetical protein